MFHRWMEETLAVLAKEEGNGAEGGQTATTFENVWQKWDEVKQQWLQRATFDPRSFWQKRH